MAYSWGSKVADVSVFGLLGIALVVLSPFLLLLWLFRPKAKPCRGCGLMPMVGQTNVGWRVSCRSPSCQPKAVEVRITAPGHGSCAEAVEQWNAIYG